MGKCVCVCVCVCVCAVPPIHGQMYACVCVCVHAFACACVCVRCIHIVSYIRHSVLIHDTTGEPLQSTPECYRMCVPTAVA